MSLLMAGSRACIGYTQRGSTRTTAKVRCTSLLDNRGVVIDEQDLVRIPYTRILSIQKP